MTNAERFAIVTPYYRETRETLERCIENVKGQSVATDHFVVSDGHPQNWLDGAGVRHLRLDLAHKDFGNTPRGIGAMLAVSEGYQAIGFLDADNWYERDHVEQCCTAATTISGPPADLIVAKRHFVLPDGTVTDLIDEPNHIDTNCYWLLEGAFHLIHYWLTMVPQISPLCDRVFYRVAIENGLVMRHTKSATVNYVGNYQLIFRAVGRVAPPDAKPAINQRPIFEWILSLDQRQQRLVNKRCGFDVLAWGRELYGATLQRSRNSLCHCGSGRRYKHCHGAWGSSM